MKILILNSIMFTPDGGVIPKVDSLKDTMMYNMCLGFRQSGHEVTLCAAEEYRPIKEEEYPFGIRFFRSAFTRLFPPTALPCSPELKRFLKRNAAGYDVIISSELFSFPSLYAALIAPGKTVIWQELSVHPAKFHRLPSRFWYNILARPLMRRPLVVARSEAARDFVSQYHKNTSDEIVDHGINADRFVTCSEQTDSLAVVAQLIKRKNVDRIISAFAQFVRHPSVSNYVLKIFGRGSLEQELKQQVRKAGIEDRVTFFGFTPHSEMVEHLSRAKASLIATSRDLNVVSIPESGADQHRPQLRLHRSATQSRHSERQLGSRRTSRNHRQQRPVRSQLRSLRPATDLAPRRRNPCKRISLPTTSITIYQLSK